MSESPKTSALGLVHVCGKVEVSPDEIFEFPQFFLHKEVFISHSNHTLIGHGKITHIGGDFFDLTKMFNPTSTCGKEPSSRWEPKAHKGRHYHITALKTVDLGNLRVGDFFRFPHTKDDLKFFPEQA